MAIISQECFMRRVTCECGQSFFPFLMNGAPREACPFCKCKLTFKGDGTLAGAKPAAPPPSQRVSELQPVVSPPAPPPARYVGEVLASTEPQAQFPSVYHQSQSECRVINLWRDRHWIVVLGDWPTFPAVCVLTGKTDNLVQIPHTVKFLRHGWVWILFFGLIGAAIGQAMMGRSLNLNLPVSGDLLDRKRRHFLIGVWIAFFSGLLFVIGCAVFIANWREDSDYLIFPMLLALFIGFGGLIYMAFAGSYRRLLCNRMEGNCMWLTGASPEFLKHLPDWTTTGPRGAPGVRYRS
jgi:hypothetical protein